MISRPVKAQVLEPHELGLLKSHVELWRRSGKKIVFTNGCFDVLHAGHGLLLQAAACQHGDIVIVGVNTDVGVKQLKGPSRPIMSYNDRVFMLSLNRFVDLIIGFEVDPTELVMAISPDVMIKGDEYSDDDIIGAELVKARGGRVVRFTMVAGLSTTQIVERLKQP